jgi:hypothetical protein
MFVEIFLDPVSIDWTIKQRVSSFRYGREKNTQNQPNKNNVYNIKKEDFYKLVSVMDNVAILCDEKDAEFISWNLYLKTVDNKQGNIEKWNFINSL